MRHLTLLLSLLAFAGCTSWRSVTPEPLASRTPARVRVTDMTGQRQTITAPSVCGDTLFGSTGDATTAVAIAGTQRLEVRRLSPAKTAGAVALAGVGVLAAYVGIVIAALATGGGP